MGTGILPDATLHIVTGQVAGVPGDFAEIGVFKGHAFRRFAAAAAGQGKRVHGFDSFKGMDEPGPRDEGYPRGYLDVGGVDAFRLLMRDAGLDEKLFRLWPGYVPDCLDTCPPSVRFSLIYIDLDHHDPTSMSIRWAWPRLLPGGILGFDDYFPGRPILASPPIDAFLAAHTGAYETVHFDNNQLFLRKRGAAVSRPAAPPR